MGIKRPTGDIEDEKIRFHVEDLQAQSLQNPIILSEAPTTDGGELKANEVGQFETDLYINIGGVIYKISMVQV